ncbi:tumor necrosis factor receptor superfamily member 14-like isoform X1 [Amblyraja radiata]|uniref:tumor necrosis factor receptor superfamily member 14-like isoform X1 n=2 Tax=Amblyraja radiata TaxID=386614 RepID=UPI001404000B|nr:tumor necrosis factor receptor superfamily member 14-like isoform X1 [Amblyraja radiata]
MFENSMKTEKWKQLPVILNISLFTALLITGWKSIDHQHVLSCSANVQNRRWHALEFIDNSIMLKQRNRYQQMIHISIGAKKLKTAAPTPYVLLLIILIGICTRCKNSCEEKSLLFSGAGGEDLKKIFFILFLLCQLSQVTTCKINEYDHNGVCCALCAAGTIVAKHCTGNTGTSCTSCPNGRYIGQANGLQRCFGCLVCYADMGFKVKQKCTKTHNSKCGPTDGYYCNKNCQRVNKHTSCPPGHGVKVKGTESTDSTCEECQKGTFSSSDSSTEECKKWTTCVKPTHEPSVPGSNVADVKCGGESKPTVAAASNNIRLFVPLICITTIRF